MDLLSMLQNAVVVNTNGDVLGEITEVYIAEGNLTLTMATGEDDGEEEDEEVDPLKPTGPLKFGKIHTYKKNKDKDDGG